MKSLEQGNFTEEFGIQTISREIPVVKQAKI